MKQWKTLRTLSSSISGLWRGAVVLVLVCLCVVSVRELALNRARAELSGALQEQGLQLEQGSFRLDPLHGLVVRNLTVSRPQDGDRQRLAQISEVLLDFDLQALFAGRTKLRHLRVRDGVLTFPAEDHPVRIEGIDADLLFLGNRAHLLNFEASYHSLAISAHGSFDLHASEQGNKTKDSRQDSLRATLERQSRALAHLETVLDQFRLDPNQSTLAIEISPLEQADGIRLETKLQARDVQLAKDPDQRLDLVRLHLKWDGRVLYVPELEIRQGEHSLLAELRARPHQALWEAEFESDLDLGTLIGTLETENLPSLPTLPSGNPHLQLAGSWTEGNADSWLDALSCHGKLVAAGLHGPNYQIDSLNFAFALEQGEFQVREAHLILPKGEWNGSASWLGSRFQASFSGTAPLAETLELLRQPGDSLPGLLRGSDLDRVAQIDATLQGNSLNPDNWKLDAELIPTRSSDPLADFISQLARYQIGGTLTKPEWHIESPF